MKLKKFIIVLALLILTSCANNNGFNKKINSIKDTYGINIYLYVNPFEKYDASTSYTMLFSKEMYDDEKIIETIDIINNILSTLNKNVFESLPDIYLGFSDEVSGLAHRSPDHNFIFINLNYLNETEFKHTLYHEIFHVLISEIDEEKGLYKYLFDNVKEGFYEKFSWVEEDRNVVSAYASTSISECMAEAFALSIIRNDENNDYFKVMREYTWSEILNDNFIKTLQVEY